MEMVPLYSHPKIQSHPKRKCEFLSNKSLTLLLIYDLYSTSNTNILFTTLLCLRSRKITAAKTASATSLGVCGSKNAKKKRKHPTQAIAGQTASTSSSDRVRPVTPIDGLLPDESKNKKTKTETKEKKKKKKKKKGQNEFGGNTKVAPKRGRWTTEEDTIIKNAVQNSMLTISNDLLQRLPGRHWAAIRDRWYNDLNPAINRTPFVGMPETRYGPQYCMLWNGYRTLGNFADISIQIFNGTRSPAQLRNCWNTLHFISFIQSEFGQDAFESIERKVSSVPSSVQEQKEQKKEQRKLENEEKKAKKAAENDNTAEELVASLSSEQLTFVTLGSEAWDFKNNKRDPSFKGSVEQLHKLGMDPGNIALAIRKIGKPNIPIPMFKCKDESLRILDKAVRKIIERATKKSVIKLVYDKESRIELTPEEACKMMADVYEKCGKTKQEAKDMAAAGLEKSKQIVHPADL